MKAAGTGFDTEALRQQLTEALLQERMVDFTCRSIPYVLQIENNKGWDYLSVWQLCDPPVCLGRALFEIWDGIDRETVNDLLSQPCIHGQSLNDLLPELEDIVIHGV